MKHLWVYVSLLLLVWLFSMWFYWPLPLVVALFAITVSVATLAIEQQVMERRARRM